MRTIMVSNPEIEGEELCAFNVRILPLDLRYQFRQLCAQLKIGMSEAVVRIMADAVDRQEIAGIKKEVPGLGMPKLTDALEKKRT